jgi:phosphoribosyl 1,2-cyclic phosphate phosphodiesterase
VHMGNGLDYRALAAELPDWAAPAYDGLEIDLG